MIYTYKSIDDRAKDSRKTDSMLFSSLIAAEVVRYCRKKNIKQAELCRNIQSKGVNISPSILVQMYKGYYQRQVSIYTLAVMAECIGKSLSDFVKVLPIED